MSTGPTATLGQSELNHWFIDFNMLAEKPEINNRIICAHTKPQHTPTIGLEHNGPTNHILYVILTLNHN